MAVSCRGTLCKWILSVSYSIRSLLEVLRVPEENSYPGGCGGRGRVCKSYRCDLRETHVTAPSSPYCKNAVVLHFIPEFFVLQPYLALGNSQSTQEGAASRSVLWVTHRQSWAQPPLGMADSSRAWGLPLCPSCQEHGVLKPWSCPSAHVCFKTVSFQLQPEQHN